MTHIFVITQGVTDQLQDNYVVQNTDSDDSGDDLPPILYNFVLPKV